MSIKAHVYTKIHIYMYVCNYLYIYIYIYIYIYMHIHIHIGINPKMAFKFGTIRWHINIFYDDRIASQSEGSPVVCHLSVGIQGVPPKQPRTKDISENVPS